MNNKPLFKGHRQPNFPSDLGYYDLRVPEVREHQAKLAKEYGIEGFCYWHYWFKGKLLLERPVLDMLASGKPDMPFCLAWANEPWSRKWSGEAEDVLQHQTYGGDKDHLRHFKWLLPALKDRRAIRIDGKPVFLIYRPDMVPNVKRMLTLWRKLAKQNGLPGLYLISIETTGSFGKDPREWGFDAAAEFQPHWHKCNVYLNDQKAKKKIWHRIFLRKGRPEMRILDYEKLWPTMLMNEEPGYPFYPGIFPRWDNSPRRGAGGMIMVNSSPEEYGKWLKLTIKRLMRRKRDHRIVFINSWNEWAEGDYLEPDQATGHAYLDATYRANTQ